MALASAQLVEGRDSILYSWVEKEVGIGFAPWPCFPWLDHYP